jgi:MOSC domain-containing protein YiiM
MAKIVSVNTGLPRTVEWYGRSVTTAIYKSPVDGRVMLRRLNVEGDRQADLSVHGGEFKAVYCYPIEHYGWWTEELASRELPAGMFGENFTLAGLDEVSVHVGDRFSIGDARVVVTQPRLPCYKLGIRFQSEALVRQFLASGRTGFYLAVEQEGIVGAGDAITQIDRDPHGVPIADITRLYVAKTFTSDDVAAVRSALQVAALPEAWKSRLRDRLLKS